MTHCLIAVHYHIMTIHAASHTPHCVTDVYAIPLVYNSLGHIISLLLQPPFLHRRLLKEAFSNTRTCYSNPVTVCTAIVALIAAAIFCWAVDLLIAIEADV